MRFLKGTRTPLDKALASSVSYSEQMRRALSLGVYAAQAATAAWVGCDAGPTSETVVAADGGDEAAAPLADASGEASAAAEASVDALAAFDAWGSPCVGAEYYLCDDFDQDAGFRHWDGVVITDGGAIDVEVSPVGVTPPSTPNVLSAHVSPSAQAYAQMHAYQLPTGAHCQLAMMVQERGADTALVIALRLGNPNAIPPFYQVDLQLHGDGGDVVGENGWLADGGLMRAYATPIPPLPQGQWVQLSFDLAIGGKPVTMASINGTRVVAQPHYDLTQFSLPTHEMLTVGVITSTGPAASHVLFDNIVCYGLP